MCDHIEGSDPRKVGTCCKCGHRMQPAVPRDVPGERELAERIVGPTVGALLQFAHARAHPGPVREFPTRDFIVDAVEEAADGANYSLWGIQQLDRLGTDDPRVGDVFAAYATALTRFAEAYNALAAAHKDYRELLEGK